MMMKKTLIDQTLMDLAYPGQIAVFKVFPDKRQSSLYWEVLVFANKGYMRRAYRQFNLPSNNNRFGAIVIPQTYKKFINGKWYDIKNALGLVLFSATQLGVNTQSHEAVHMALSFLRRARRFPRLSRRIIDLEEEKLAYCIGRCAMQLNHNFYRFDCYRS